VIGIFLGTLISNQLWVGIFIQFMLQAVHSVVEIQQAKNLLKIKNEVMVFNRKGLFDYKIIHLIQLSVPMAYILSFRAFGENFPRYAIEQNLGFEALGVFTSIYYILYLFGRMGTSFIQVMLPRMTYNFNLGLFQSTRKLVIISIISCVSLGIISNLLLNLGFSAQLQKIILGSTSNEYGLLLNYFIIVISLKMGAHILIEFLTATRNFSSILLIGTIVSLSTIFSSSFFVPQYGLIGSIIALGIGAIIDVTLGLWFVLRNTSNRRKAQV